MPAETIDDKAVAGRCGNGRDDAQWECLPRSNNGPCSDVQFDPGMEVIDRQTHAGEWPVKPAAARTSANVSSSRPRCDPCRPSARSGSSVPESRRLPSSDAETVGLRMSSRNPVRWNAVGACFPAHLTRAGRRPARIATRPRRRDISRGSRQPLVSPAHLSGVRLPVDYFHAWVELHIEQGPLLEREGIPIGIVTAIAAPASYRFVIDGFGGHAGALLMPDRRDALCAAAELILSIERHTLATGVIDSVATVGTCDVYPGAVNSVPSRVTLQLDIRDTDPTRRESVMQAVRYDVEAFAARRQVHIAETLVNADELPPSSPHIVDVLDRICLASGITAKHLVSRAYHDSSFIARIAPIAMIFIPCRNGVSHRPDEFASPADIALGCACAG